MNYTSKSFGIILALLELNYRGNIMSIITQCIVLFHGLVDWLVAVVGHLGYPGVIGLMFLESSFFHSQAKSLSHLRAILPPRAK